MSEQMRRSLLTNKNASFQKLYEECLVKIQRIKQKNDFMQRQIGSEIEESVGQELRRQKQFLQTEIGQIKDLMDQIQNRFKDPESKNKLKTIKVDAQKQIQRNKLIMKDFVLKSFMNKSRGAEQNENQQGYLEEGKINFQKLDANSNEQKESIITQQNNLHYQEQVTVDFQLERKMEKQKKQLLNQVEQSSLKVNQILNDMAVMVDEQGEDLNHISQELLKTQKNVSATNEHLNEASKSQKKSKKKYIGITILIILIVAAVVGVVFILKK